MTFYELKKHHDLFPLRAKKRLLVTCVYFCLVHLDKRNRPLETIASIIFAISPKMWTFYKTEKNLGRAFFYINEKNLIFFCSLLWITLPISIMFFFQLHIHLSFFPTRMTHTHTHTYYTSNSVRFIHIIINPLLLLSKRQILYFHTNE